MDDKIDIKQLRENNRRLSAGIIMPATEECDNDVVEEHAAEPIKKLSDINLISRYLIMHGRYRDNMLFIVGINFGLRISDLRNLRFCHLINSNLTFKDTFPVFEKKTRNTRKKKKNRYITINNAVVDAVTTYLEHTSGVSLSDYMFRSESNRGSNKNKPLTTQSVNRLLRGIAEELGLSMRVSSHTLRKTFCYHQMLMSNNDSRKLLLLQKMLNHSTPAQTLEYIGITSEEIEEEYKKLNLGSMTENYLVDSSIVEAEEPAVEESVNEEPVRYVLPTDYRQEPQRREQPRAALYN